LGSANTTLCAVFRAGRVEEPSVWGSMTAISQPSPALRTTTPPAEISRIMAPKLTGLLELVTGTAPGGEPVHR
jgi:hypothetical protein